jgi:hypothetical protein
VKGVNSSMIYLIYCKNFYKCCSVTPLSTIKIERKKKAYFVNNMELSLTFLSSVTSSAF